MKPYATGRAFGYLRVSTAEQSTSGLGLQAQSAAVTATAERLGVALGETFTDAGISGGLALEQRPALLAAIEALRKGDTLIVAKRDRLGRDVLNVAMIERLAARKGARIVSAAGEGTEDDGPTSVLMRQIIDSFAQYERALIRTRTKAALSAKRARGERAGTVPFGFRLGGDGRTLETNPAEQETLEALRAYRAAGLSLQRVAEELNGRGMRTRSGSRFRREYVYNLLAA
jgi:DNA invertase Pin-like site-specific DNA recombinase